MNKLTVITHNINESVVEQRKLDGYINATALTRAYKLASGKRRDVSEWLSNKRTQESLKHLSSKTGIPIESLYKVVRGSPETGGGTWIHPQLADNFRKHLDLKPNNSRFAHFFWSSRNCQKNRKSRFRNGFSDFPKFSLNYHSVLKTLFLCDRLRHSTFELQAKTPIKSFRFFLTQFKIGEPGVIIKKSK